MTQVHITSILTKVLKGINMAHTIYLIGLIYTIAQGCTALNVILRPSDTAREMGHNVTLACIVSGKTPSESVQWKYKPSFSDAFNALTFNENVLSSQTKYGIQWTYNLTVYNLQPEDAGLYRCTAAGINYDAILTVVDLPQNVTVDMVGEPNIGEDHNLTCKASNTLPAPTVQWVISGVNMTEKAVVENTNLSTQGYVDVTSYLPLSLDESLNGGEAKCVLSYRGWESAVIATYTIRTIYPGGYANFGTGFYNPDTILYPNNGPSPSSSASLEHGNGVGISRDKGMFLIKFVKQDRNENISWEIQQYAP